jgi:hypothetical protein
MVRILVAQALAVLGSLACGVDTLPLARAADLPPTVPRSLAASATARLDPWLAQLLAARAAQLEAGLGARMTPPTAGPAPALLHVDETLLAVGRVRVQLDTGPAGGAASALRPACEAAVPSLSWEYDFGHLAQVVLDIAELAALAEVPGLFYAMRPPAGLPMAAAETIVSAGVPESGADAFHAAGYRGEGLLVGVLDICFDGASQDIGGELPTDTKVRMFGQCTATQNDGRRYHGTACAEIVHDVAPAAGLRLANASTLLEMEAAVRWLCDEGVSVISHSVGWFWGPGDGTGDIADVVHQEAVDRGIVWVNAAGNQAERYWGGPFRDQDFDGVHEFDQTGDEGLTSPEVLGDTDLRYLLTWDRWPYSSDLCFDVEIYLDGVRIATSAEASNPAGYAYREVYARTSRPGTVEIVIRRTKGTLGARLRLNRLDESGDMPEHRTSAGSLVLPADSPRVLSVGAYRRESGVATLEDFSSRGPNQVGLPKPELCALDGVRTNPYDYFQGTSAAAPLAAGIVALVIQAAPDGGFFDFRWEMSELLDLLAWSAEPAGFADPNACVWGLAHVPPTQTGASEDNPLLVSTPARAALSLSFRRPVPGPARLTVYDLQGRRVGDETWIVRPAPGASALWPARDRAGEPLPTGMYVLVVRGPGWAARRSVLLLP